MCVCLLFVPVFYHLLQDLRNAQSEQLMGIRREEEMEMSDDDSSDVPCKKARVEDSGGNNYN